MCFILATCIVSFFVPQPFNALKISWAWLMQPKSFNWLYTKSNRNIPEEHDEQLLFTKVCFRQRLQMRMLFLGPVTAHARPDGFAMLSSFCAKPSYVSPTVSWVCEQQDLGHTICRRLLVLSIAPKHNQRFRRHSDTHGSVSGIDGTTAHLQQLLLLSA